MRVGRGLQLADRGADEADRARVVFGSFSVLKFAGVLRLLGQLLSEQLLSSGACCVQWCGADWAFGMRA